MGQEQAGAPGGHGRLEGEQESSGPGAEARREPLQGWTEGWMQGSTPRETGAGTELGQ